MIPAKRPRKKLSTDTTTHVLVRSARRCPLCFGLHGDSHRKRGQIAHLDRDSSNDDPGNLQFLCLPHHDEYDTTTSQSKGMTEGEVRFYSADLDAYVEKMRLEAWPDATVGGDTSKRRRGSIERCSVDVYKMRLPLYKVVAHFVNQIVATASVSLDELLEFVRATSEVLFLFDDSTDSFVQEIYAKAVHLRSVSQRLEHLRLTGQSFPAGLLETDRELLTWFSGSVEAWRVHVRPYLHLRDDAT